MSLMPLTRPDMNQDVQSFEMARGLKFPVYEVDGLMYLD